MLTFCLICLLCRLLAAEEVDVGLDGQPLKSTVEKSVEFVSFYDGVMDLYWTGSTDGRAASEKVKIVELYKGTRTKVNTFDGHIFHAESRETGIYAEPRKVVITPSQSYYEFAPVESTDSVGEIKKSHKVGYEYERIQRDSNVNHGLHPAVTLLHSGTTAMSAKFRSLVSAVDYYYDDGRDGIYQGRLKLGQESTTNTYEGHVFYFTRAGDKQAVLERFKMDKDRVLYVVTDPEDPPPKELQAHTEKELRFMKEYRDRTGLHWRHYYGPDGPRAPPELFMWPAKEIGQVHRVTSREGKWRDDCDPDRGDAVEQDSPAVGGSLWSMLDSIWPSSSKGDEAIAKKQKGATPKATVCQDTQPVNLTLEVVSLQPRVYIIENFLSHYEADRLIELSKDKLGISTVGNDDGGGARTDATRTSMNTWLGRKTSRETESLFLRAADLLNLDEKIMHNHRNAEDMQVVHYENGQKYDPHHDWGVSGYPESRFITLLLYLTDKPSGDSGGETSFPKADNGRGIKVHPGKGSAVLFYNLLEDGNGDDLALHAALPVKDGHEKFLANWWLWTPKRR